MAQSAVKVLVACEFSGVVRDAFRRRGHDAISCDLLPTESDGPHYRGDVFDIINDGWDLLIAHPPCTYLTVAGNKWMKPEYAERFPGRAEAREDAIRFVLALADAPIPRIAIENPVGVLSTRWRKPEQVVHPYHFGDRARKATCLWLKNLPKLTPTDVVEPEIVAYSKGGTDSPWHMTPPSPDRWKLRSTTFPGLAEAMAEQWALCAD